MPEHVSSLDSSTMFALGSNAFLDKFGLFYGWSWVKFWFQALSYVLSQLA